MPQVEYVGRGDGFVVATWDRVLLEAFSGGVTLESLRARAEAHRQLYDRHPGRVLSLTVARNGIRLPEAEVRSEAVRVMKQIGPKTEQIVVAVPGQGFWASAARSALTGMMLLAPKATRMQIVGGVEEAVRTLGISAGEPPFWQEGLREAIDGLGILDETP